MQTYRRCDEEFVSQEFGSDGLLLSLQTGHYFSLNHTAMDVWKLLEEPTCVEEVAKKLSKRYEADLPMLVEDIHMCLKEMCESGFVSVQD